ncbi:hypothetical protein BsWGS_27778 [Bradybaena similaris]
MAGFKMGESVRCEQHLKQIAMQSLAVIWAFMGSSPVLWSFVYCGNPPVGKRLQCGFLPGRKATDGPLMEQSLHQESDPALIPQRYGICYLFPFTLLCKKDACYDVGLHLA